MEKRPLIALTMGDVTGVGPEIIVQALHQRELYEHCRPCVIGDAKYLERADTIWKTGCRINRIQAPADGLYTYGTIDCMDMNLLPLDIPFAKIDGRAGDAAFRYVREAIDLALAKKVDAICTAPLNKEAMQLGGHKYPGHTEILADFGGAEHYGMMFASEDLHVILVTIHVGLR